MQYALYTATSMSRTAYGMQARSVLPSDTNCTALDMLFPKPDMLSRELELSAVVVCMNSVDF